VIGLIAILTLAEAGARSPVPLETDLIPKMTFVCYLEDNDPKYNGFWGIVIQHEKQKKFIEVSRSYKNAVVDFNFTNGASSIGYLENATGTSLLFTAEMKSKEGAARVDFTILHDPQGHESGNLIFHVGKVDAESPCTRIMNSPDAEPVK